MGGGGGVVAVVVVAVVVGVGGVAPGKWEGFGGAEGSVDGGRKTWVVVEGAQKGAWPPSEVLLPR